MFILTFSCLLRRPCYHLALFMGFVVEGKTRASLSEMFLLVLLLFVFLFKEKVGFVLSRYCGSLYTFRMFCFVFIYDFRIFFQEDQRIRLESFLCIDISDVFNCYKDQNIRQKCHLIKNI